MNIFNIFSKKKPIPAPWRKYYTEDEMNLKTPNITMYEQLKRAVLKYPDNIAYQYFNTKIKYINFIKKIDKCVKSWESLGIKKGDIVTLCAPNVPEVLISLYALNKLGAIANMLHPLSSETEMKDSITSTRSKYLVIIDVFYDKVQNILSETKLRQIIFISASDSMDLLLKLGYKLTKGRKFKHYPKNNNYIPWKKFMKMGKAIPDKKYPSYGKNTAAVILHSGGTSGNPKNVVLQNRAFTLAAVQYKITMKELKEKDSALAIMPNFHGFGLSVLMHTPFTIGCKVILVPQFDPKKFDVLLKKTKPNCILGVPTLYEALITSNNVKKLDLSFIKYIVSGGDVLSNNLEDRVNLYLEERNCKTRITQGYGLSEALAGVCISRDNISKKGSIGVPIPSLYMKVIDEATRGIKPYGEVGEIVIHTRGLMMGYLDNELETNTALQVHDDGHVWLHTGDLGYMDEDGFFFYKGRQKRMIVSSGYNVYPSHVEEVIESHPSVLQCTVVGVPHHYKGEVPKAFIVLRPGYFWLLSKGDIKRHCEKNLAKYMIPKEIVYRKKLPKTKLGKVDFRTLQDDNRGDDNE